MRISSLSALSVLALAASVSAQYLGEGPYLTQPASSDTVMKAAILAAIPGTTGIAQCHFRQISGTKFYTCLTTWPSPGKVYAGTWDTATNTFTSSTDADAFNNLTAPNTGPFALAVTNDGLTAVCDTAGSTFCATRATTTVPFGTPVPLVGVPAGGYLDSMVAVVGGQLKYFYVSGQDIYSGDFTPSTATVANVVKIVTNPIGFSASHSPSPMNDATGEARALLFAANGATGADGMFTSSLLDLAPKFLLENHSAWINNGGHIGGNCYYADSTGSYATNGPRIWGMTCTGSMTVKPAGGLVTLTSWAPFTGTTAVPYLSGMLIGTLGSSATPIPGISGNLALSLLGLASINMPSHNQSNGVSQLSFTVGGLPPGGRIDLQNVMIDLTANKAYLGNSAQLDVQ